MGRRKRTFCFYCGANVSKGTMEMDHMPVPQMMGGLDVVPACKTCHDMKDRFILTDWSDEWRAAVMRDMPKMSRETKIFLAKAMVITVDAALVLAANKVER